MSKTSYQDMGNGQIRVCRVICGLPNGETRELCNIPENNIYRHTNYINVFDRDKDDSEKKLILEGVCKYIVEFYMLEEE